MSLHHRIAGGTLGLAWLCAGPAGPLAAQALRYDHPADADVEVRSVVVDGAGPAVDLYYPDDAGPEPRPAVVFVLGYPDSAFGPLRSHDQYVSWARLVAAEGFVGVLHEVRDPESDLRSVLGFIRSEAAALGVDPDRVGLWSCSGNTALALEAARNGVEIRPAAFVAYYGLMPTPDRHLGAALDSMSARFGFALPAYDAGEAYPPSLPMLLVRAGADRWAEIRGSIDHFTAFALEENLDLTVRNYPAGQHAFDVLDDTAETRAIIRETLTFLREHL